MQNLSDYIGQIISITQRSIWKREYEIRSEKEVIGKFVYPKFFSERVECKLVNDTFEFRRPHIFSNDIEIRKSGYQLPIAVMHLNFLASKGIVDLPRGKKVVMKFGTFKSKAEIYHGENDLIAIVNNKFSFKEKCEITIERRTEILDENPWLVFLAFYFLQLKRRNTGVAH
uniref:Uncharacterized protein n=1 Tax=Ignavibacterium album TaxID=591197 RepID=A0A832G6L0_9BACT